MIILYIENSHMSFWSQNFIHMYKLRYIDNESIFIKIPKRINWYSESVVFFTGILIPLTVSIGFEPCHVPMILWNLPKINSSWVFALELSINFWRIKQSPATTNAAPSPTENVAYVSKSKQSTWIQDLFHWRFCINESKLTKLSCDTPYCSINKITKLSTFHLLRQQICLDMNKSLLLSF